MLILSLKNKERELFYQPQRDGLIYMYSTWKRVHTVTIEGNGKYLVESYLQYVFHNMTYM